jgi:hypothetical protein
MWALSSHSRRAMQSRPIRHQPCKKNPQPTKEVPSKTAIWRGFQSPRTALAYFGFMQFRSLPRNN